MAGSRTLALIGDMKKMTRDFVRGLDIHGYGISLAVGVGIPIPVLNADIIRRAAVSDDEIFANMVDYSVTSSKRPVLKQYSYAELRSGVIEYEGQRIRTSSLSSYRKARSVAVNLKDWIEKGEFQLSKPVSNLPEKGIVKPLEIRE